MAQTAMKKYLGSCALANVVTKTATLVKQETRLQCFCNKKNAISGQDLSLGVVSTKASRAPKRRKKIKIWKATPRKLNLKDTCEVCGVIAGIKSQIEHLIAERRRGIQKRFRPLAMDVYDASN